MNLSGRAAVAAIPARDKLLAGDRIDADDVSLWKLTDRVGDAVQEILGFFRVYHSMRYVRQSLVLRLTERPGAELLDELNSRFADLLVKGQFTTSGPLPEEKDDPDLADLPRLVFHYNRRNLGRLRQLIDLINRRLRRRGGRT